MSEPKPTQKYVNLNAPEPAPIEPEPAPAAPAKARRASKRSRATEANATEPKGAELAARIRKAQPPKPERSTPVYGRAKAGHPQLNVRVPPDVKRRLERYCFEHDVLMADVIERLILDHIPER